MHLKKIKLVGFKSFVDPTIIHLRSKIAAILGPNGCGKSNIIDAVRWVMGESSAKQLRGTAMADVIFNGSAQRKPLGQASIELIFDNNDAGIGGEYARYSEIAVRRVIGRDGVSDYYLNGTNCRRRDIVDLFLGTGLGVNSYAIIEQGTISQFIEAKPDELRLYLEEAAGISKYKERRRETENRIRHTRDNLARLNDIRLELDQQLKHLKTQANAAERYKKLKHEERQTKAELYALHAHQLRQQLHHLEASIHVDAAKLEDKDAAQHSCSAKISAGREQHQEILARCNAIQENYYRLGADVARLEQQLQHEKERKQQLNVAIAKSEHAQQETRAQQQQDQAQLDLLQGEMDKFGVVHPEARAELQVAEQKQQRKEQQLREHSALLEACRIDLAYCERQRDVAHTKLQHTQQTIANEEQRLHKLHGEFVNFNASNDNQTEIQQLEEAQDILQDQNNALHSELTTKQQAITEQRAACDKLKGELNTLRHQMQVFAGKRASLESLQEAALGKNDALQKKWLHEHSLEHRPRLLQELKVAAGWEKAVEAVLTGYLDAIYVDDIALAHMWNSFPEGRLALFDAKTDGDSASVSYDANVSGSVNAVNLPALFSKIEAKHALCRSLLAGIYVAADLTAALQARTALARHESIVTVDGIWLGRDWLVIEGKAEARRGIIQRERELKELVLRLQEYEQLIADKEDSLQEEHQVILQREQEYHEIQRKLRETTAALGKIHGEISAKHQHAAYLAQRYQTLQQEIHNHESVVATTRALYADLEQAWRSDVEKQAALQEQQRVLQAMQESLMRDVDMARTKVAELRKALDAQEMRREMLQTQLTYLRNNLARATKRCDELVCEHASLIESLQASVAPLAAKERELQEKVSTRFGVEKELQTAKLQVSASEHALSELEEKRAQLQEEYQALQQQLERQRLGAQELKTKRDGYVEQVAELGYVAEELLQELMLVMAKNRNGDASDDGGVSDNDDSNDSGGDGSDSVINDSVINDGDSSGSTSNDADVALNAYVALGEWEARLLRITTRVERLGAVNLAAIDELTRQNERKTYLDAQHQDLIDALTTLEQAINKIDQETKEKFHLVFQDVDARFRALFPYIFGGGKAYLELCGNNLLESGVMIFAQPPGKRNSSIHLLSGGEKALTAIALIFAIFQRNPAPFCILDEVDAPLDDTNVARFCRLVKEMAETVQLIFISHNKLTLEIADQLTGVTMQEPGVSRIVEVDIQQALEWVEKK